MMKTVQMTLDDELVREVDEVVKQLGTTRSAFTREALRAALTRAKQRELEQQHRDGYARYPVRPGEVSDWDDEQVWVE